jgi:hypothetical protein
MALARGSYNSSICSTHWLPRCVSRILRQVFSNELHLPACSELDRAMIRGSRTCLCTGIFAESLHSPGPGGCHEAGRYQLSLLASHTVSRRQMFVSLRDRQDSRRFRVALMVNSLRTCWPRGTILGIECRGTLAIPLGVCRVVQFACGGIGPHLLMALFGCSKKNPCRSSGNTQLPLRDHPMPCDLPVLPPLVPFSCTST